MNIFNTNSISIFEIEIPNEYELYFQVQDLFNLVTPSFYPEIPTVILDSFEDPYFCKFFIHQICFFCTIRPFVYDSFYLMIKNILNSNFSSNFKNELLIISLDLIPKFIRDLYYSNYYNFEEIFKVLKKCKFILPFYYFYYEIPDIDSFINKFNSNDDIKNKFNDIINNNLNLDDFYQYGWDSNSIIYFIKFDDLEKLQKNTIDNFNWIENFEWSIFEYLTKPSSINLLNIAARFGSLNCFKFILLQNFSIDNNTIISSIYSNNIDLIDLTLKSEIHVENILSHCVLSLDLNLFEKFKFYEDLNDTNLFNLFLHPNLRVIELLLKLGIDINIRDSVNIFLFNTI